MQIALAVNHPLADRAYLLPEDLAEQTLITYPVERERLDVFQQFLDPAGVTPAAVRHSELTLMMVQMVASGRGLCALPHWVLVDYVVQDLISVSSANGS